MGLNTAAFTWFHGHHGVISAEQLKACGISSRARDRLVATGVLVRMHRGVYSIASQSVDTLVRCAGLSAFLPDGFTTGPTGGRFYGLRRMPMTMTKPPKGSKEKPIEKISYAVPHGGWLDIAAVDLRQSCCIEATDIQERTDGLRLASPWRLAFDLAADLTPIDLASVIEQILATNLCTLVTLAATARRLAHPARPGSREFVTALTERVPGGPLESHPEVLLAKALKAKGVPIIAQSTWLDLPNGKRIRLDMSVPDIRWGLEVDVHPDHFLQSGTADRRRDRQCHQIGWQVDRVTPLDLMDLDNLVVELVDVYNARVK
jgi:Transcriptional regulator, AbiEi antitoxin